MIALILTACFSEDVDYTQNSPPIYPNKYKPACMKEYMFAIDGMEFDICKVRADQFGVDFVINSYTNEKTF